MLIGDYPTGIFFEVENRELSLFYPEIEGEGWAPTSAREAQAIAIYGGSIIVVVRPWGELFEMKK
jgi:hypothetical protein